MFIRIGTVIINTDRITAIEVTENLQLETPWQLREQNVGPKFAFCVSVILSSNEYGYGQKAYEFFDDNAKALLEIVAPFEISIARLPTSAYSYADYAFADELQKYDNEREAKGKTRTADVPF